MVNPTIGNFCSDVGHMAESCFSWGNQISTYWCIDDFDDASK